VPRIVVAVFEMPLLTVNCKFSGALAVTVTVPGPKHVASPVEPMVAPAVEVLQDRPSACVSSRLLLSLKFPIAVNPT
jgi:hypothetical protein